MKAQKFETGKSYGNDLTIDVLSRTEKTLTIKTVFGTQKIKIRNYHNETESISFKCWLITSADLFDKNIANEIAYYNAYCK